MIHVEPHLQDVSLPANLRINDQIREYRERCESDEMRFAHDHFEIMLDGVSNIGRYISEIRAGKRPAHG